VIKLIAFQINKPHQSIDRLALLHHAIRAPNFGQRCRQDGNSEIMAIDPAELANFQRRGSRLRPSRDNGEVGYWLRAE
jgi:hypothetical protein